ncbi:MAG: thiamine-phosphate kinase [Candidatus Hydrogenedentota bacterium]|nr:MAG: thiamine-phosphate kinase [Candidatus Hydrogenedentota bacterium]
MDEWEVIARARERFPVRGGSRVIGIGDDAAVVGERLLSTELFVEGVHFDRGWMNWDTIGRRCTEIVLSDIAAMGGTVDGLLVGFSGTLGSDEINLLLDGISSAEVPVLGGDTVGGGGECGVVLAMTVLGNAKRPVLRKGAQAGDVVYVSGALGGVLAGQKLLERGRRDSPLVERFLAPRARLDLASFWGRSASAMIDISDGLSSELWHIAGDSRVRIEIESVRIPIFEGVETVFENPIEAALSSGEELELLATAPVPLLEGKEIGCVKEGEGVFLDGTLLRRSGFTHRW